MNKGKAPELSANALTVLKRRYLQRDSEGELIETPEKMFRRVASNIAAAEVKYGASKQEIKRIEEAFYAIMRGLLFLPNSPTLMNAGTQLQQLSACFVLSVEDSIESIYEAICHTAIIHKSGGGTGFSFSRIRPNGSPVGSTSGVASGPVSFMKVFDASTEAIKQGGRRRGANMGILNVHHPDILEFISSKEKEGELRNFNISVGATDAFMQAVRKRSDFKLIDPRTGEVTGHLSANGLLDKVAEMAWRNGEPGIVFLDKINEQHPVPNAGAIEATNPCGEQPLLPYESCNLGSINLARMTDEGSIAWDKLREVTHLAVRFLDDVIDANHFPLPSIAANTKANRKIGLGVMGFADLLVELGISYRSDRAIKVAEEIMRFIQDESKLASSALAKTRGAFPNFSGSRWEQQGLQMRNATTTTIAPTGSISMIADCASGIEPFFSLVYFKTVLEGNKLLYVNEHFERTARREGFHSPRLMKAIAEAEGSCQGVPEVHPDVKQVYLTALDIAYEDHIKMQAAFQKYTDNAVSKTINLPYQATREDVKTALITAWEMDCKGITVYRNGSREEQVLTSTRQQDDQPVKPRPRPPVTHGITREVRTGCGDLYVTITKDDSHTPFEVFAQLGKSGGCAASQTEAIGRLASLALRSGIPWRLIVKQLKGITCDRPWGLGKKKVLSCADAVGQAIEKYMQEDSAAGEPASVQSAAHSRQQRGMGACPECGSTAIEHEGGCYVCKSCGYSECE